MKKLFGIIFIYHLLISCNSHQKRVVFPGIEWEEIELSEINFERIDTIWTNNSTIDFLAYIKPKHFTLDSRFTTEVVKSRTSNRLYKLNREFGFEIVGDTIYYTKRSNKTGVSNHGNTWYKIEGNSYERLSENIETIKKPEISQSYGKILRYTTEFGSDYVLQETIDLKVVSDTTDFKKEGIYFVGLPGLNVVAKESFQDIVK